MAHDVFISYSSEDKAVADAVCANLENKKIRCWIAPRDIPPGEEWGKSIIDAINQSKVFVLVFSKSADHSPQVLREVERAVNREIPIIPIRIDNVLPHNSMEYYISTTHWLDAISPPLENHINKLAKIVQNILNPPKEIFPDPKEAYVVKKEKKVKEKLLNYIIVLIGLIAVLSSIYLFATNWGLDSPIRAFTRALILILGLYLIVFSLFHKNLGRRLDKIGKMMDKYRSLQKIIVVVLIFSVFFIYSTIPLSYSENGVSFQTGPTWKATGNNGGSSITSFTKKSSNGKYTIYLTFNNKSGALKDEFTKRYQNYSNNSNNQNLTNGTFFYDNHLGFSLKFQEISPSMYPYPAYIEEIWITKNNTVYFMRYVTDKYDDSDHNDFLSAVHTFQVK